MFLGGIIVLISSVEGARAFWQTGLPYKAMSICPFLQSSMVGRNVEASNVWFIVDFTAAVCAMSTPKLENGWDHQTKSIESLSWTSWYYELNVFYPWF